MRSAKTQVQINMRTRATGKNVSYNGEEDDDVSVDVVFVTDGSDARLLDSK